MLQLCGSGCERAVDEQETVHVRWRLLTHRNHATDPIKATVESCKMGGVSLPGESNQRRINEAERQILLSCERLPSATKNGTAWHELQLNGIQEKLTGRDCGGDVEPGGEDGDDLQEDVLREQSVTPLAIEKALHDARSRRVMDIVPVVEGDEKARVEDQHG